jgi:gliding motility-associated-like protein
MAELRGSLHSNIGIGLSGVSGNGNIGTFIATNITNAPISSIITVTPVSNTCNGLAVSFSYIVNPTPTLSSGLTPTAICSGTNFSYTATSLVSGTSYLWSRLSNSAINNNTITSGTGSTINEALTNITPSSVIGVYAISLTANNCTNSQNVSITVKPTPVLSSTLTPTGICSGSLFSYSPQSSTAGTSYSWARPAIFPITNPSSSGINSIGEILNNPSITAVMVAYNYTLTANGCNNNQQLSVLINPIPTLTPQITSTCSSIAFSITPSSVPAGTTYTWGAPVISPLASSTGGSLQALGQPSLSQTLTNVTATNSTALYLVVPTVAGCIGNAFSLTVTISPTPNLSSQTISPICGGNAFIFNPSNIPAGTTYSWQTPIQIPASSLTGATAQPISQTTVSQILNSNNNVLDTAIYTITPSTALCTGIPFTLTVPVKPLPIVANYRDTICSGTAFNIIPNNVPVNTTYTWVANASVPSGSITGNRSQTTPVSVISQTLNNISSVVAQAIYIITPIAGNCAGPTFTLTENVWRANPVYPPQIANICSGSAFDVTPGNTPTGTLFTWNNPILFPAGSALGVNGSISPASRISQTITNLTNGTDTLVYTIIPMVDNCIGNAFSATIKVSPLPQATISSVSSICLNQLIDTLSIKFTGSAPWSFSYTDNGQTATKSGITTSPFNLFLPPVSKGTTNRNVVIYNLKDGSCLNTKDSFSFVQQINPLPVGQIISLHGNYLCNGIKDTLFVLSKDSLGYQWKLNGTILQSANTDSIATLSAGTYQTLLTNQYNCSDTATGPVTLILAKPPILKFMVDTACIASKITFTNLTDTSKTGSLQWQWKFGDGNTSAVMNPVNTYQISGNYRISLSATQQFCTTYPPTILDTTINIRFPIPGITMPSVSAYKGQLTPVSARALPGYKYQWLPSAGIQQPDSSSTNFNLSNTQQYAIKLISPDGCITTDSLLIRVFEENTVNIFVPKSFTPNGDGVNDILYPYIAGIQQFHYFRILNRFGKLIFESKNADTGWNGTINGVPQPMSIYFWIAEGVANDGSVVQKTGQVLLIR